MAPSSTFASSQASVQPLVKRQLVEDEFERAFDVTLVTTPAMCKWTRPAASSSFEEHRAATHRPAVSSIAAPATAAVPASITRKPFSEILSPRSAMIRSAQAAGVNSVQSSPVRVPFSALPPSSASIQISAPCTPQTAAPPSPTICTARALREIDAMFSDADTTGPISALPLRMAALPPRPRPSASVAVTPATSAPASTAAAEPTTIEAFLGASTPHTSPIASKLATSVSSATAAHAAALSSTLAGAVPTPSAGIWPSSASASGASSSLAFSIFTDDEFVTANLKKKLAEQQQQQSATELQHSAAATAPDSPAQEERKTLRRASMLVGKRPSLSSSTVEALFANHSAPLSTIDEGDSLSVSSDLSTSTMSPPSIALLNCLCIDPFHMQVLIEAAEQCDLLADPLVHNVSHLTYPTSIDSILTMKERDLDLDDRFLHVDRVNQCQKRVYSASADDHMLVDEEGDDALYAQCSPQNAVSMSNREQIDQENLLIDLLVQDFDDDCQRSVQISSPPDIAMFFNKRALQRRFEGGRLYQPTGIPCHQLNRILSMKFAVPSPPNSAVTNQLRFAPSDWMVHLRSYYLYEDIAFLIADQLSNDTLADVLAMIDGSKSNGLTLSTSCVWMFTQQFLAMCATVLSHGFLWVTASPQAVLLRNHDESVHNSRQYESTHAPLCLCSGSSKWSPEQLWGGLSSRSLMLQNMSSSVDFHQHQSTQPAAVLFRARSVASRQQLPSQFERHINSQRAWLFEVDCWALAQTLWQLLIATSPTKTQSQCEFSVSKQRTSQGVQYSVSNAAPADCDAQWSNVLIPAIECLLNFSTQSSASVSDAAECCLTLYAQLQHRFEQHKPADDVMRKALTQLQVSMADWRLRSRK